MFADFRSVNVKIRMEKNASIVHLPGFKYDDFDRAGILTVCIFSHPPEARGLCFCPGLFSFFSFSLVGLGPQSGVYGGPPGMFGV